jgi:hypothetical protein
MKLTLHNLIVILQQYAHLDNLQIPLICLPEPLLPIINVLMSWRGPIPLCQQRSLSVRLCHQYVPMHLFRDPIPVLPLFWDALLLHLPWELDWLLYVEYRVGVANRHLQKTVDNVVG